MTESIQTANQHKQHSRALTIPARIVSYLFHPVFMLTVMTVVLYKLSPASFAGIPSQGISLITLQIFVSTAFFPILITLLLKAVGFIESIHMTSPKDRIIPLIGTMICYFWINRVVGNLNYPLVLHILTLGSFWGIILVFLINIFVKISLHTTAAGGVLGIMLVLMFTSPVNMVLPFFLALFVAGLIGTARMILGSHVPFEIWLGYIVGILVQVCAFWYLR